MVARNPAALVDEVVARLESSLEALALLELDHPALPAESVLKLIACVGRVQPRMWDTMRAAGRAASDRVARMEGTG